MLTLEHVLRGPTVDPYWDRMRPSLTVESHRLVVRKGETKTWNVTGMDGVTCRPLPASNEAVVMLCTPGAGLGFFRQSPVSWPYFW